MSERFCVTGKICFVSPKEASETIRSLSKRNKNQKFSTYPCRECEYYHITTSSKKLIPQKGKKNKRWK